MNIMKKTVAVILSLVLAFSCFGIASSAATKKVSKITITQLPNKLTYYYGTDWDYGHWRFTTTDDQEIGVFEKDPQKKEVSFMHNGGYYYYGAGDIGMPVLEGMIYEVTYTDGTKKSVKYTETIKGVKVIPSIDYSLPNGLSKGEIVVEVYFLNDPEPYDSFKIKLVDAMLKGDVNIDKSINSFDALLVLRHVVGVSTLGGDALTVADINNDKKINSLDALEILRIAVK